jgi:adenylate kinase family enzyme
MKIMLIGNAGTGKSTLARWLAAQTGYPVMYLDQFWHTTDYSAEAKQWFIQQQKNFCATHDNWIIDGNYSGSMAVRLAEADLVIWLQVSRVRSIIRVIRRSLRYRRDKNSRPDMAAAFTEHFDKDYWDFLLFIWHYDGDKLRKALAAQQLAPQVIVLHGTRAKEKFMADFKRRLG